MKVNIETLKDTFKIGYDTYLNSREEGNEVERVYHNTQYTLDQENTLDNRGQPKETFNIVKLFTRQLIGYYTTVLNVPVIKPVQYNDIDTASILNDLVKHITSENHFISENNSSKKDGLFHGLMVAYKDVVDTGRSDNFGRPLYKINIEHVPASQVVIDPMSTKNDYSDARYVHRFKWLPEETVKSAFGKQKMEKLVENYNHLNVDEAEIDFKTDLSFQGVYKNYDNYLIVHSIIMDDREDSYSVYWCGDTILRKDKVTYKDVKNPYTIVKIDEDEDGYYGIFREVIESQKAVNQAIIQIQQMANSNKAFVQDGAVEDLEEFTKSFNRVNSVTPVNFLDGIEIQNLSGDIQQQYIIIDKAFDRIQRLLGITDAFLGMAFASDSGRKVKLQQNSTIVALNYLTEKFELFIKLLGVDIANLIKQYYTAEQVVRIADEHVGDRWIALNQPLLDDLGKPILVEDIDPASGEPRRDDNGNYILVPLNDSRTDISFTEFDIEIQTSSYHDEDEKNQLMLESILSGNIGQTLATVNPAGYMRAASLSIKSMKSKYSSDIASILEETSAMLRPQPEMQGQLGSAKDVSSQMSNGQNLKGNM